MRRLLALASGLAALVALAVPVQAAAEPALLPGFQDEVVFSGLEQPTNFRFAPDGRVFVAEKPGRIKVFDSVNDTTPTLFADLRGDVYDNGDRGLLGLALDPKFDEGRPYVYALYTWDHVLGEPWNNLSPTPKYGKPEESGDPDCPTQNNTKSCLVSGRLVVLEEDEANPDHAVTEGGLPKEKQLLEGWCQQFNSHSIGELQFGPEGALYVSGGDGASYESIADYGQLGPPIGEANPCGDPPTAKGVSPKEEDGSANPESQGGALRSQNMKLLNGAILRVDPDTGAPLPDNPLAGNGNVNAERTVAKGFRNPFRFALDEGTGEIYSGNVGSSEIEEIDRFAAPPASVYNSGWPCYEGIERQFRFKVLGLKVCDALYKAEEEEEPQTAEPFFTYSHSQTVVPEDECPFEAGSAISGVSLYEGSQFPAAYKGSLFFGDAVRGCIWVMEAGDDGKPDPLTAKRFLREGSVYAGVKIAEGPGEYLYYASRFSEEGKGEGEIHRIAYKPNSPVARVEAKPPYGTYDGSDKFETIVDASKSSDPNGDPLTYEWDVNEDGVFESGGSTKGLTFTKAEQEAREKAKPPLSPNRVVTVRVEDDENLSSVARITIYPGDKPPTVTITKPTSLQKWKVGDLVKLEGTGFDQGDLSKEITSPRFYYWETRMAHCPDPSNPTACHEHPLQTFAGIRRPELIAPQHDYPSYIKLLLRVSDERGLQGTATFNFQPQTVDLSLVSDPPGINLLGASVEEPAPFDVTAIEGSEIQLSAPLLAEVGGTEYVWQEWSDHGAASHPILVTQATPEYKAIYAPAPPDPEFVEFEMSSEPPGVKLTAGATTEPAPFTASALEGSEIQISAPQFYEAGGKKYEFEKWSDSGSISHSILVEEDTAGFQAFYTEVAAEPPAGSGGGTGGGSTPPPPTGGKTEPPATKVGRHPPARTAKTSATFGFSANTAGARFNCKLDSRPKQGCRSPKTYKKLKPGRHTFKVWATTGILTDPTPAKFSWKILPPKR